MNTSLAAAWQGAVGALPLVAILRGIRPDEAETVGNVLHGAGWRLLEVPLNSPEPLASIATLARRFPDAIVGAGTVRTEDEVRAVHTAGGRLIVSPHFDARVVRAAAALGMVALPGVMTPTEAFAALDAGATGLKLFPAEVIPPAAVKAVRAVLPQDVLLFPVGGIAPATMAPYRAAGANGFGIGSALYQPGRDGDAIAASAQAFADAWTGTIRT
ncbi:2-dehydro-3-deoxy-6-phosphogalactonate aldolase [Ramlibacter sp. USB13]|uniref:2-dehydro-3-deoxy-6-phosphogalactonate aldolase n=1 Tax=Ramlibacter cellulosilyticus TaxID=2764187 RepID=A0A923MSC1_9BURK|nr:2-dehydro-3-deoxy-6-phosphogalactonate aldolase [Ramlibacter cellulosilyticus]MBC5784328.1 2-dehydro-3-deoxy-6-phosphogalactonate aldolase [Ramlibacter cellulosilyticus]